MLSLLVQNLNSKKYINKKLLGRVQTAPTEQKILGIIKQHAVLFKIKDLNLKSLSHLPEAAKTATNIGFRTVWTFSASHDNGILEGEIGSVIYFRLRSLILKTTV